MGKLDRIQQTKHRGVDIKLTGQRTVDHRIGDRYKDLEELGGTDV